MAASTWALTHTKSDTLQSVSWIVAKALLWTYTFVVSLEIGASIYQSFVITPLWAGSLPDSVQNWNIATRYPIMPARFWAPFTLVDLLVLIAILAVMWFVPRALRNWMALVGGCGLVIGLSTIFFFVPILQKTVLNNGAGLSGPEITRLVTLWVNWNSVRVAVACIGWVAGISALAVQRKRLNSADNY